MTDDLTPKESDTRPARQSGRRPHSKRRTEDEELLDHSQPERSSFVNTDPWRVLRIMGEFVAGFDTLADLGTAVSIFGSARTEPGDPLYADAVNTARLLAEAGLVVITGGGPGIMEAGNRGAELGDGVSVGLGIELPFEQGVNDYVEVPIEFRYFFVRKTMFVKYAQAFVIFPGGFGTMDEMFEALTLIQTGKIHRFPVVLYQTEYWQGLIDWLRQTMLAGGKIAEPDLDLFRMADTPEEARDLVLDGMRVGGWVDEKEEAAREVTRRVYQSDDAGA